MKKEFTPIAMRCSEEQFELIKPKLRESNIKFEQCHDFKNRPYLTSPLEKNDWVSNYKNVITERKIHEQWNENIFLEACGIKVEPEYKITKEQIIKYDLKELFPEVFEVEKNKSNHLEINKWFVNNDNINIIFYVKEIIKSSFFGYGISWRGEWEDNFEGSNNSKKRLATTEEVCEALKNEAVKRYKIGDYFKCAGSGRIRMFDNNEIVYTNELNNGIYLKGSASGEWLMLNGKWAEIVQTITKDEAEKELGKKIV